MRNAVYNFTNKINTVKIWGWNGKIFLIYTLYSSFKVVIHILSTEIHTQPPICGKVEGWGSGYVDEWRRGARKKRLQSAAGASYAGFPTGTLAKNV